MNDVHKGWLRKKELKISDCDWNLQQNQANNHYQCYQLHSIDFLNDKELMIEIVTKSNNLHISVINFIQLITLID